MMAAVARPVTRPRAALSPYPPGVEPPPASDRGRLELDRFRSISGIDDVVVALLGGELVEECSDALPRVVEGTFGNGNDDRGGKADNAS